MTTRLIPGFTGTPRIDQPASSGDQTAGRPFTSTERVLPAWDLPDKATAEFVLLRNPVPSAGALSTVSVCGIWASTAARGS